MTVTKRGWLNEGSGMAAYEYTVEGGYRFPAVDAEIILSDCTRQIALDFNFYSEKDIEGRLRKLETLKEMLSEFETVYLAAIEEARNKSIQKQQEEENQSWITKLVKRFRKKKTGYTDFS